MRNRRVDGARRDAIDGARANTRVTGRERLMWIVLALVPSSYLLGVTTYITSDIAAVPLLWVIPLALYLLTFIIAFSRERPPMLRAAVFALPLLVSAVVLWMIACVAGPAWLILGSHLLAFFVVAVVCHGELSRRRPHADHLTEYYLWISLGGVLGGLFNALVAPLIFNRPAEYPIAIALGCMLCPLRDSASFVQRRLNPVVLDIAMPVLAAALTIAVSLLLPPAGRAQRAARDPRGRADDRVFCRPQATGAVWPVRRARAGRVDVRPGHRRTRPAAHRSFFGVHQVVRSEPRADANRFNELFHGSTLHGRQHIDPATLRPIDLREPLTYYHRTGPIGRLLAAAIEQHRFSDRRLDIALVGLGVGSLAAYAEPDVRMTYYEIDPAVEQIAQRSGYFTFLSDARARGVAIGMITGDARLDAVHADVQSIDVLVLDAFSGDSIPVHLLTREAFAMYFARLRPGGVIAVHVSNQYLNLEPVVARAAAEFGCTCVGWHDLQVSPAEEASGKTASAWVVLGATAQDSPVSPQAPLAAVAVAGEAGPVDRRFLEHPAPFGQPRVR